MQSGKFVHLVTIEQPSLPQDARGNFSEVWLPVPGFTRIFAEVLPDRATEYFAAKQIQATRNAVVRLYYQPGITPAMRLVHHKRPDLDEYWDIAGAVDFQDRQREVRLYCTWREAEGYRRGTDLDNPDAEV